MKDIHEKGERRTNIQKAKPGANKDKEKLGKIRENKAGRQGKQ